MNGYVELIKRKLQRVDRKKAGLIGVIIGIAVIITLLIYNYFRVPSYDEMITRLELLMRAQKNFTVDYLVTLETNINGKQESLEGLAHYNMTREEVEWSNDLSAVEGTFYDTMPHDMIEIMKTTFFDAVETYHEDIPCYLLNGVGYVEGEEMLIGNYSYMRVMACFDKQTGYPLQYSLMIVSPNDAVLVIYDSLSIRARVSLAGETNASPLDEETKAEIVELFTQ